MKRLLIFRHGKSDWHAGAATDHERPLNRRGTGAAMTMGRVLTRIGEQPNLIFTSSAVRARETALLASDAGGWDCETIEFDELYGTSVAGALEVAARAPDEVDRLMLVGHEPAWSYLVYALTGASVQIKTATLAAVDLNAASWDEAPITTASLAYLLQPKLFTNWEL